MSAGLFLVPLKTLLRDAMHNTFGDSYPEPDFRDAYVSLEYPREEANYPGIWVDFEPTGDVTVAGIDHREFSDPAVDGSMRRLRRFTYQGTASFTIFALTSLERDRLFDEVVRVMSVDPEDASPLSIFRNEVESNDFIACNFDFDRIGIGGFAVSEGTPWGSPDFVYEGTITMSALGEFTTDPASGTLIALTAITPIPYDPPSVPDPTADDPVHPWV